MKKFVGILLSVLLLCTSLGFAQTAGWKYMPPINKTGYIGDSTHQWAYGYFDKIGLHGITYTWPSTAGTTSYVLTTDGVGTLSWSAAGGAPTLQSAYTGGYTITSTNPIAVTNNAANNYGLLTLSKSPSGAQSGDLLALTLGANATGNGISFANSGTGYDLLGSGSRWSITKDAVVTLSSASSPTAVIVVSPSAAATTGIDVSNANLTNAISIGSRAIAGTNFGVTGAGAITGVSINVSGSITASSSNVGTAKQDALVPASASPHNITLDAGTSGQVVIAGTSTGQITLGGGGGATAVVLPATVNLTLSGGLYNQTYTSTTTPFTLTANSVTANNSMTISATSSTGNIVSATGGNAVTGSVYYAGISDGTGFTGYYFQGYNGAATDFSVARYGATVIRGLASTNMLTITAGHEVITSGNLTLTSGNIVATSGNLTVTSGATSLTGAAGTTALTIAQTARVSGVLPYFKLTIPTDTGLTNATEAPGFQTVTGTRTWNTTGTVAVQREYLFAAPTYASGGASQTFTNAATVAISAAPILGSNAVFTNAPYALWVQSGITELDGGIQSVPAARTGALAVTPYFKITMPTDTAITNTSEAIGFQIATGTRTWNSSATTAVQREVVFTAPTYASGSASQTFTNAATVAITNAPLTGANVVYTNTPYALWVQAGLTELDGQLIAKGTGAADSAASGYIGEILSSVIAVGAPVSLTTGTGANVTTLALTAGDWDVWGQVAFIVAGTTTVGYLAGGISASTGALPTTGAGQFVWPGTAANTTIDTTLNPQFAVPMIRVSTASTPTYYLVAQSKFGTSTVGAYGGIYARRRR